MSNPVFINCPKNIWTKVATNIQNVIIHEKGLMPVEYLQMYKKTGESAPTDISEGIPIFEDSRSSTIVSSERIDVYIYPLDHNGIIRVDLNAGSGPNVIGDFNVPYSADLDDEQFVKGQAYSYKSLHTINALATVTLLFDMTTTPVVGKTVIIKPILYSALGGPIEIKYYANTIATPGTGTLGVSIPRRGGFPASQMIFRKNPTIVNIGTFISDDFIPSTAGGLGAGATNTGGYPFELRIGIDYAVTIKNLSNQVSRVLNNYNWAEVPLLPQP